jgi:hypothetical protein
MMTGNWGAFKSGSSDRGIVSRVVIPNATTIRNANMEPRGEYMIISLFYTGSVVA